MAASVGASSSESPKKYDYLGHPSAEALNARPRSQSQGPSPHTDAVGQDNKRAHACAGEPPSDNLQKAESSAGARVGKMEPGQLMAGEEADAAGPKAGSLADCLANRIPGNASRRALQERAAALAAGGQAGQGLAAAVTPSAPEAARKPRKRSKTADDQEHKTKKRRTLAYRPPGYLSANATTSELQARMQALKARFEAPSPAHAPDVQSRSVDGGQRPDA